MRFKPLAFTVMLLFSLFLVLFCVVQTAAAERIVLYTSIHEPLLTPLHNAFAKAHPDIRLDYLIAGSGSVCSRVFQERAGGKIVPDIVWITDSSRFSQLEAEGVFMPYTPPSDSDFFFSISPKGGLHTIICLHTAGIAYNTRLVKTAPVAWSDIFSREFTGVFGIGDPSISGIAQMGVALLTDLFGWDFARNLSANKAKMTRGMRRAVDDTASGELAGCLAAGYIVLDRVEKGAPLGYVLPPEIPLIPSVLGLVKNSRPAAGAFVDFLLSPEGQTILARGGVLPVRGGIALHPGLPVTSLEEALERAIPLKYPVPAAEMKVAILKLQDIMDR